MSPRTGRPPSKNPKSLSFNIRLDAECEEILKAYCEKHNVKRAEAIREGVKLLKEVDKKITCLPQPTKLRSHVIP